MVCCPSLLYHHVFLPLLAPSATWLGTELHAPKVIVQQGPFSSTITQVLVSQSPTSAQVLNSFTMYKPVADERQAMLILKQAVSGPSEREGVSEGIKCFSDDGSLAVPPYAARVEVISRGVVAVHDHELITRYETDIDNSMKLPGHIPMRPDSTRSPTIWTDANGIEFRLRTKDWYNWQNYTVRACCVPLAAAVLC